MGRIRSLKPEILEDDRTASLSDRAWRLFVSGIVLADDFGRLRASLRNLSTAVFSGDSKGVMGARAELTKSGLWEVYTVRGQEYAVIRNWMKHQRIDNKGKPRCPGPEEHDESVPPAFHETSDSSKETHRMRNSAKFRDSPPDQDQDQDQDQDPEGEHRIPSDAPRGETPRGLQPETILTFPADGSPSKWDLTADVVAELEEAYEGVDVVAEARKALMWVKAAPDRRKTARGYRRFLTGWIARAKNNGRFTHRAPIDRDADVLASVQAFIAGFDPPAGSARIESEVSDGE